MLRLFRAGLVAGALQLAAAGVTTAIVLLFAENKTLPSVDLQSISALLVWLYLLTSLGIVFTSADFVKVTARRISRASRSMSPTQPRNVTEALMVQLWFAAIGFAILELRSPPEPLIAVSDYFFGSRDAASSVWSGVMSIGVAAFGANAEAARRAL